MDKISTAAIVIILAAGTLMSQTVALSQSNQNVIKKAFDRPNYRDNYLYNGDEDKYRGGYPTYRCTRVQFEGVYPPINANWILPDEFQKKLVITDAPKLGYIDSFWQTVGNIASDKIAIVMISHSKERGKMWDIYWPENGITGDRGSYTLRIDKETRQPHINQRIMILEKKGSIRAAQVEHYHFDAWTDGTSDVSVQALGDLIFELANKEDPLIIHCSAGINRSGVVAGAYIAVKRIIQNYGRDISRINAQEDPHQFVREILNDLRDPTQGRSPYIIHHESHYVLLHTIIAYICENHFNQKWTHFPLE